MLYIHNLVLHLYLDGEDKYLEQFVQLVNESFDIEKSRLMVKSWSPNQVLFINHSQPAEYRNSELKAFPSEEFDWKKIFQMNTYAHWENYILMQDLQNQGL